MCQAPFSSGAVKEFCYFFKREADQAITSSNLNEQVLFGCSRGRRFGTRIVVYGQRGMAKPTRHDCRSKLVSVEALISKSWLQLVSRMDGNYALDSCLIEAGCFGEPSLRFVKGGTGLVTGSSVAEHLPMVSGLGIC